MNKGILKTIALTCVFCITAIAMVAQADTKMYFVHSDHLGTAQKLTDKDQNVVWEVNSQTPFGEVEINNDPDGDGAQVEFNLRFPGQYADKETGLNYNVNRYYDKTTGRYTQSDPIGLAGGINTYAYVGGNPLKYTDPLGLDFGIGVNSAAAGGNGHTTLYYQDKDGNWHAYDQGANRDPSSGQLGYLSNIPGGVRTRPIDEPPESAMIYPSDSDLDNSISECADKSQVSHHTGDKQYNLLSNNCTDAAVDVLSCAGIRITNPAFTPRPNSWFKELKKHRPRVCISTKRGIRCKPI